MAKLAKPAAAPAAAVRLRRAYFDCSFGQLHVRTAFPGTGGFDELVTLICLHGAEGSSRAFATFLPEMAATRSVYAPDLPGCGESDASPTGSAAEAAHAIAELAADLRLRQIDVIGFGSGAIAALELAAARPEQVRRLVLTQLPAQEKLVSARQPALILRGRLDGPESMTRIKGGLSQAKFSESMQHEADLFTAAPQEAAKEIDAFLSAR